MKEERERRNDFGKIRVGQRDLVGMDFVASMGVVRLDAALMNLEKWLWIEIADGDNRWHPRTDLLAHRW